MLVVGLWRFIMGASVLMRGLLIIAILFFGLKSEAATLYIADVPVNEVSITKVLIGAGVSFLVHEAGHIIS